MLSSTPISVLHVEVGGSYGGSLRALELYLTHSQRTRFLHDVLFYYPTPGAERLRPLVRSLWTLYDVLPARFAKPGDKVVCRMRKVLKGSSLTQSLMEVLEWIDIGRSWPNVLKIKEALCAGDYALVHVNNTFTYQLPTLFAAHIAGIPVVAHVRNPIRACAFSRMAARLADCIVTVSRVFEKELNGWGLPIAVCTCYDCTELPATDQSVSSSLRVSLLGSGNVLIGSVGRLEEQKGYQDLVHAARRVIDLFPEVRFAIAGDGPLRPSLERSIAQLGLESKFRLCGFRNDVTNFLAALDLFVSSSHWEGLPLAIVEAMLLGKRVVATDVGGTSEVVLPGQTGELVPPSNPGAMAIAIAKFVSRPKDPGSWAKRTLQVASTLGDPDRNAQAFDEVIQGVMLEAGFAQADLTNSHW